MINRQTLSFSRSLLSFDNVFLTKIVGHSIYGYCGVREIDRLRIHCDQLDYELDFVPSPSNPLTVEFVIWL